MSPGSSSSAIDKALFDAALALNDPAVRAEFLATACGNNAARKEQIEALLSASEVADDFFLIAAQAQVAAGKEVIDSLPPSPPDPAPIGDGPGSRIGPYQLQERIGEGGWGVVYLAEQQHPLRRRVALKIVRLGLDTEKVVARFEMERQALALMDHPNIARVLDAGATDSGRPYFVMELVHGVRITEHCDTHRLGLRQRLELFIEVCQAIQHAHQKGVIHRDIKPSNILVAQQDGRSVPKVIDFGIIRAVEGRLTDQTSFTGADQFIGTPAYMSPEQAEGGADTRSDVYSLGVLLCELLTGETPFDGKRLAEAGMLEMLRILREEEPPAPSAVLAALQPDQKTAVAELRGMDLNHLSSAIRGDLDWIVLKAIAKDRRSRYETVNGLARDIQRFLNDEPVMARPPGRLYLAGKLVRRHKALVASTAAVMLAMVAAVGISGWFYLRERDARQVQARLFRAAEAARANEARLLEQAKARESVSQAAILLAAGNVQEADALLVKTPLKSIEPSMEAAKLLGTLGDWNAIRQRWRQAADCYTLYRQANRLDRSPVPSGSIALIGIAPTLVEAGDFAEYNGFREWAITRYANSLNPINAASLLKISLLRPAEESFLERLRPAGDVIAGSLAKDDQSRGIGAYQSAFMAMSMGLFDYRRGNFAETLDWNRRCLAFPDKNEARATTAHAVSAMAAKQLGRTELAHSELAQAQDAFKRPFAPNAYAPRGENQGLWLDWAIARVLLREAASLLEDNRRKRP